jgi:hypothetical protein
MAASYQPFTSARATEPHFTTLIDQLKALDPTAGLQHEVGTPTYVVKKATVWTTPQRNAAQTVIDTAPASSAQLDAQAAIDQMSIFEKAIVLTILDQFNVLRSKQTPVLPPITVPQMIAAIRTKAGEL